MMLTTLTMELAHDAAMGDDITLPQRPQRLAVARGGHFDCAVLGAYHVSAVGARRVVARC